MYKGLFVLVLAAAIAVGSAGASASPDGAAGAIRSIHSNAADIRANARIYQWRRMSANLARIVAAERNLNRCTSTSQAQPRVSKIDAAIHDLRAAWMAHDTGRIRRTAEILETVCLQNQTPE
jgi:hypothetical protein